MQDKIENAHDPADNIHDAKKNSAVNLGDTALENTLEVINGGSDSAISFDSTPAGAEAEGTESVAHAPSDGVVADAVPSVADIARRLKERSLRERERREREQNTTGSGPAADHPAAPDNIYALEARCESAKKKLKEVRRIRSVSEKAVTAKNGELNELAKQLVALSGAGKGGTPEYEALKRKQEDGNDARSELVKQHHDAECAVSKLEKELSDLSTRIEAAASAAAGESGVDSDDEQDEMDILGIRPGWDWKDNLYFPGKTGMIVRAGHDEAYDRATFNQMHMALWIEETSAPSMTNKKNPWVHVTGMKRGKQVKNANDAVVACGEKRLVIKEGKKRYVNLWDKDSLPLPLADDVEYTDGDKDAIALTEYWIGNLCSRHEVTTIEKSGPYAGRTSGEKYFDYVMSYVSLNVRHPGRTVGWMPIFKGVEGDGKSMFALLMGALLGEDNVTSIDNTDVCAETFNDYQKGYLFVFVEEIEAPAGKRRMLPINNLKTPLTNPKVSVRGKHEKRVTIKNRTNYGGGTNSGRALPMHDNDRRFGIFYSHWKNIEELEAKVAAAGYGDLYEDFFTALVDAFSNHAPALIRHFMNRPLATQRTGKPFRYNMRAPHTEFKDRMADQADEGLSVTKGLVKQVIEAGGFGFGPKVVAMIHLKHAIEHHKECSLDDDQVPNIIDALDKLGYVKRKSMVTWDGGQNHKRTVYINEDIKLPDDVRAANPMIVKMLDETTVNSDGSKREPLGPYRPGSGF